MASALDLSQTRSGLSWSSPSLPSGLENFSSNQRPVYCPAAASNVPMTSQKSRGTNLRILASRSTTMASVGVWTRPTVVLKKPPSLELNAVIARVPLMPTSQSASDRLYAASASGSMSLSSRSCANPSRMAAGVMDCSQSRLMGCFALVNLTMLRKINSPSRPASQALISASTSARLISFLRTFSRGSLFSIGSKSKCGGMTGRCLNVHLPRAASTPSGGTMVSKWPTADETT